MAIKKGDIVYRKAEYQVQAVGTENKGGTVVTHLSLTPVENTQYINVTLDQVEVPVAPPQAGGGSLSTPATPTGFLAAQQLAVSGQTQQALTH